MKMIKNSVMLCIVAILFASCASSGGGLIQQDFESTAETFGTSSSTGGTGLGNDDYTGDRGYVYGRFFKAMRFADELDKAYENDVLYGITVENVETEKRFVFVMESSSKATVQMASLVPGTYRIVTLSKMYQDGEEIIASDGTDYRVGVSEEEKEETEKEAAEDDIYTLSEAFNVMLSGYEREFVVEPNKAVYLGDFVMMYNLYINTYYIGNTRYTQYVFSDDTFPPLDRFDETTSALYERYPDMKDENIEYSSHMENVTRYLPWDDFFFMYSQNGTAVKRTE